MEHRVGPLNLVGQTPQESRVELARPSNCLFEEEWWLEAVAPGAWNAVQISDGGQVSARMAFVSARRFGLTHVGQPVLTQTLGPWYLKGSDKYASEIGRQREMAAELLSRLPRFAVFSQNFHRSIENWLPFQWAGFSVVPRMSYVLEDLSSLERIWCDFDSNTRKAVRKAQRLVQVSETDDIELLLELNRKTFLRQGIKNLPFLPDDVRRLDLVCASRGARKILVAKDEKGAVHAAAYIVWDDRCAYYLIGGGDPELRNSGASSLLIWEAIQHAGRVSRSFDFEGSTLEPIERFFRGFGARQKNYMSVRSAHRAIDLALALKKAFSARKG